MALDSGHYDARTGKRINSIEHRLDLPARGAAIAFVYSPLGEDAIDDPRHRLPELGFDRPAARRELPIRRVAHGMLRKAYGSYKLAAAPVEAWQLMTAGADTTLGRLAAGADRKRTLAARPFVCAGWSARQRLQRMIEHCALIDTIGHPFDITSHQYVELASFVLDGQACRFMLDRPQWLESDGLLCASFWAADTRVFAVSFCLAGGSAGRIAYVGGIQGHRSDDTLDLNRRLTKAAHGLRPRDLAFELFRMMLPGLGVTQLKCVANANRYHMTRRARMTIGANDKVQLDYDDTWACRGGQLGADGFFLVPVGYGRRDLDDIPAKKRAMYKKRYAMLDELDTAIGLALAGRLTVHHHAAPAPIEGSQSAEPIRNRHGGSMVHAARATSPEGEGCGEPFSPDLLAS